MRLKKNADKWVAAQLEAFRKDEFVEPPTEPLGEYLDRWLAGHPARPSTRRRYEIVLRCHIKPALGAVELGRRRPQQVQDLYQQLTSATALTARAVLRQALDAALRVGLVVRNPTHGLRSPSRPARRETPQWTGVQPTRFLEVAGDNQTGRLLWLLAYTGLRLGEAVALRWVDIAVDGAMLRVEHGRVLDATGHPTIGEVDGARSRRRLALDPATVDVLRRQVDDQAWRCRILGPDW